MIDGEIFVPAPMAAAVLEVSRRRVYQLGAAGTIRTANCGTLLYHLGDLQRYRTTRKPWPQSRITGGLPAARRLRLYVKGYETPEEEL